MCICQIMLYTLNLHTTICQLYLSKAGGKKKVAVSDQGSEAIHWEWWNCISLGLPFPAWFSVDEMNFLSLIHCIFFISLSWKLRQPSRQYIDTLYKKVFYYVQLISFIISFNENLLATSLLFWLSKFLYFAFTF